MLRFLKIICISILVLTIATFLFIQQKSFGKLPSKARLERVEKSKNYRDHKFQNLVETPTMAEDASYLNLTLDFFSKGVDREPSHSLPSVKTDLKNLETSPQVIWFGHSSFLIAANGKRFLVDPIFSDRPSPVQYAGSKRYPGTELYTADDFPSIDAVIISHDHYDHLDYGTITKLIVKTSLFCVPLGVSEHLLHWGVPEDKIIEFDWWDSKEIFDGYHLTATPARHFSGRGFKRDKTLWSSYALKTPSYNFFIGGDSGYDDSFKTIGEKLGPFDLAMLECGQYNRQWPFIHMMPEQTVQASIDLKSKVLLPVHWGKFTLALHPWSEPISRALVHAEKMNVMVTTPKIGEPVQLEGALPRERWWENFHAAQTR